MTETRRIVLVGTGAYVTRDAYGPGVIARSLAQWCENNQHSGPWLIDVITRSEAGQERFVVEWKAIQAERKGGPEVRFTRMTDDNVGERLRGAHACFICVPDEAHADWAEGAIAAGVPTWIVKPLTGEAKASRALCEAAETAHVPLWVDYHKRFDVSNRQLRSTCDSEEYGSPRLYSVRYSQPRDLPLDGFAWAAQTDVFTYIGCHYVDQLFYVMPGLQIDRVNAQGIRGPVHDRYGANAWYTVLARLDGQWRGRAVTAQFEVGWSNPLGSPTKSLQVVEVNFDRGRLFLDQMRRGAEVWSDASAHVPNPYFFSRIFDPIARRDAYQGYGYESIRHFLDFTLADEMAQANGLANDALPWARSAVQVDAVLDLVRQSLED